MTQPLMYDVPAQAGPADPTPAADLGDRPATVDAAVPCAYCRAAISTDRFAYWSPAQRLLSATCPDCHRRMTLTAGTWRTWRDSPDPLLFA